jgi:glycosyltransferase involved in cell wall biosynthesis
MQLPLWKRCNFFYFGSIHVNEEDGRSALNSLQHRCITASQLYLANTQFEKQWINSAGIPADKIAVLGVGVNAIDFKAADAEVKGYRESLGLPADAVLIAYAGRVERTKNVRLLVQAFANLASENTNIFLLIAGAGSDHVSELQQYIQSLDASVQSRIKWKVNFSTAEKKFLFNAMDILVLPSNNESFGIVFLEAWACRKPVIGAAIGAVKDVIDDNQNGLLITPNSIESLENSLKKLISDKALRIQMGEQGYNKVLEHYTWDIITKKLRQHYLSALNNSVNV